MNDEDRNAQIHQGKSNCTPSAAGADQYHCRILRTVASEAFLEAIAPTSPIEIVASGPAFRPNRDGIDRADLCGLRVHRIEKRDDLLFERIGDVCAGEASGFGRIEELR
jgi:hypothetical protein